jgi:hypothetical protein
VLAQLLLELVAHVVEVRLVRVDDPVGADIAEALEAHLVQRAQQGADLAVDVRERGVVEPVQERVDGLALDLGQDDQALRDERLRVIRGEHRGDGRGQSTALEPPVDEDLLGHLPVEEVGVDLDDDGAVIDGAKLEDRALGAIAEARHGLDAPIGARQAQEPLGGWEVELEVGRRHRR